MYRRHVLGGLWLGWLASTLPRVAHAQEGGGAALSPDEAMKKLMDGNKRYVDGAFRTPDLSEKRRRQLASGQAPYASILGCADSRVPPEYVFDAGLGDLFTDRVAGNTVSEPMLGSIEFAVNILHVPVQMVLGHEKCGGVTAAVQVYQSGKTLDPALMALVDPILPAVVAVKSKPGDLLTNAVQENARMVAQRLRTAPSISQPVSAGKLKVVAAYYSLDNGSVTILDEG